MSAISQKPPAAPTRKSFWQRATSGRFLIISIVFHLLLILVAGVLVVQTITKRKQNFKAAPPAAANRAVEHKIQMVKQKQSMSAPPVTKRVVTTGLSKVALPEMPEIATPADPTNPMVANAAQGSAGFGPGNSMGGGNGLGAGGGSPFFGVRSSGAGLEGTFYDFKRQSKDQRIEKPPGYRQIVDRFTTGSWGPNGLRNFMSPVKLYAKVFLFPVIRDTEAGKAFQSPETAPGGWVAHYTGTIVPPVDGNYRFVGFGDNVMIAKLGGAMVLDASDNNYTGRKRESAGKGVDFPGKKGTPIFFGNWFNLQKGKAKTLEIAIGDEGGHFCAGLFLQKQGQEYTQGRNGVPNLPLFAIGTFTDAQKTALKRFLPDTAFTGPVFTMQAAGSSDARGPGR